MYIKTLPSLKKDDDMNENFSQVWDTVMYMIEINNELNLRKSEVQCLFKEVDANYQTRRKHDKYLEDVVGELKTAISLLESLTILFSSRNNSEENIQESWPS